MVVVSGDGGWERMREVERPLMEVDLRWQQHAREVVAVTVGKVWVPWVLNMP